MINNNSVLVSYQQYGRRFKTFPLMWRPKLKGNGSFRLLEKLSQKHFYTHHWTSLRSWTQKKVLGLCRNTLIVWREKCCLPLCHLSAHNSTLVWGKCWQNGPISSCMQQNFGKLQNQEENLPSKSSRGYYRLLYFQWKIVPPCH